MSTASTVTFSGAFPIGDTNPLRLPIKDVGPALGYYVHVLGFTLKERMENGALLTRDSATIGLVSSDDDPEQASIYFAVSDVDALHEELVAKNIEPSAPRHDTHGGKSYRVIFAKEPYGVCFCFGQEVG